MNFKYLFFNTYVGDFLQVIPLAFIVMTIYAIYKYKIKHKEFYVKTDIFKLIFVFYIAGVILLTDVPSPLWNEMYHRLFYGRGLGNSIKFFEFNYCLKLNFSYLNIERLGNIALFLPFGILYKLSYPNSCWWNVIIYGFTASLGIEIVQLFLDRACDINDLALNTIGTVLGIIIFYIIKGFAVLCSKFYRKDN